MKYIDLFLQKIEEDKNPPHAEVKHILSEIIENHQVTVVLGSPGSGKTSILQKFNQDKSTETQFVTIRKFLRLQFKIDKDINFLLLDGLDEYKSIKTDKSSVIEDVGEKIKELENVYIVITCRQADWFGNSDTSALNSIITESVAIYSFLKLDNTKKEELAELYEIKNTYEFINKFDEYGFLENPQMFKMIAELYNSESYNDIGSKTDLYLQFISHAIEKNEFYKDHNINELEFKELLNCVGYISLFYIFSGIEVFNKEFINKVASSDDGFSKTTLRKVLNTNLFSESEFIHKTIAEFSAAQYLVNHKYSNSEGIQFERLKALFTINGKVPTTLRGSYTWLCSLTKDENLLDVDPYNLLLNGDCDTFSPSLKLKLLSSIKNLSISNPHFVRGGDYYGFRPTEFYQVELDDYILAFIKKSTMINDEYEYLIYKIISSSNKLSDKTINTLSNQILDEKVDNSVRYQLIKVFKNNLPLLLQVLNKIKEGTIKSDEAVIDGLLDCLYPEIINHTQVVEYLVLYEEYVGGHLRYLDKTEYKNKHILVELIFKEIFKGAEVNYNISKIVNYFINDYLVETALQYENSLSSEEIYKIISKIMNYEDFENRLELRFKFESFKPELNFSDEKNQISLQKLSNELFDLFVNDKLTQKQIPLFGDYVRIFDRNFRPNNISRIFLNHVSPEISGVQNKNLYTQALRSMPTYEELDSEIKKEIECLAKKYKFEKDLELYKKPIKPDWKIEDDKRTKEVAIENQLIINKNEAYFAKLTDDKISKDVGILYKIAQKLFISRHYQVPESNLLSDKTFTRLKRILKNLIYKPLNTGCENLNSLAESNTGITTIRPIDITYYVSCSLNLEFTQKIHNHEFSKYLYILCQCNSKLSNIIKGNFLDHTEYFEIDEVETLKDYYKYMLKEKLPEYSSILESYIKDEDSKSKLINLAIISFNDNTTNTNQIINAFLYSYHFEIKLSHLKSFVSYNEIDSTNKEILKVLIAININDTLDENNIKHARKFFSLFSYDTKLFDSFTQLIKVKLINLFMNTIDPKGSILDYDDFVNFISRRGINSLDINSIETLYHKRINKKDSWSNLILQVRDELKQKYANSEFNKHSIQSMRKYILNDSILDKKDFFTDVCLKINAIKDDIEANRDQQKNLFYNSKKPKTENDCRDALLIRLKDKYRVDFELSPEKQEAENTRVDINIKYKENLKYEVQIECKRDNNTPDVYTGIPNQLINKYLSKNVKFGVYLIFYFGFLKNKNLLLKKVKNSLLEEYKNNIEIILLDLR